MKRVFYKARYKSHEGVTVGETVCLLASGGYTREAKVTKIGIMYFTVRATVRNREYRFKLGCQEGDYDREMSVRIFTTSLSCVDLVRRTSALSSVSAFAERFARANEPPTQDDLKSLAERISSSLAFEVSK